MNTPFSQQTSLGFGFLIATTTRLDRLTHPVALQRIENAALSILLLLSYHALGFSWWLLAVLVLAPDLSIITYTKSSRFGARTYNAVHNYSAPVLLAAAGIGFGMDVLNATALIWGLHIAVDRTVGFGLKYTTSFHHNHLTWR